MDSHDLRPDDEVLADVVRRGTALMSTRKRRRQATAGAGAAVVVLLLIAASVVVGRSGNGPDRLASGASSSTGGVAASTGAVEGAPAPRPVVDPAGTKTPPTVRVGTADHIVELKPWTTCWTNYCADGSRPTNLQRVRGGDLVYVEFPVEGWSFEATATIAGSSCGRRLTEQLAPAGPTMFSLPAQGDAGDYVVDLFGRGPGGDVSVSFSWHTDRAGPYPKPSSTLSLLANHDGSVDSYGVEFSMSNLARTPSKVTGAVTVTSAEGADRTIELHPSGRGCDGGEGQVALTAPLSEGKAAAALGDPPFTYDVSVTLDGVVHRATATWPKDVDDECAPCVPLSFDPPLPGAGG